MKKKLLTIFICLVMAVGLLPTVAFAAENYDLYVDGEQFTSEKTLHCLWRRNRKLRPAYKDPYAAQCDYQ